MSHLYGFLGGVLLSVCVIVIILAIKSLFNEKEKQYLKSNYPYIVIILILTFWSGSYFIKKSGKQAVNEYFESKKEEIEQTKSLAYVYCKNYVKERLKAPATADFPFTPTVAFFKDGEYYVQSYVDAQNSFGAKLRTYFICIVKCKDNYCDLNKIVFTK